jgi:hypothetical protein
LSIEARESLVSRLSFQDAQSKSDLLNPDLTSTDLIEVLLEITALTPGLEITAVRTDHHPDGYLGVHSHQAGRAVDCWPLNSPKAGDYQDENGMRFQQFLKALQKENLVAQVGLGGAANTVSNRNLLGQLGFEDDGEDHVHIGV